LMLIPKMLGQQFELPKSCLIKGGDLMAHQKTYEEINEKIKRGEAVVVTAEEVIDIVEEQGLEKAAREIDVVTTGTFGPM
ncbi:MAG TPA: hypothetical protein DD791_14430, partial [Syntrophomonas sp.]|nr:hypothetical protein [Syntrophomonas sp.]